MKKNIIIIFLLIISYLVFFIQMSFFNNITMWGVKPNLILIYLTLLVTYTNKPAYIIVAIVAGLIIDFSSSSIIGATTLSLLTATLIVEKFNNIIYTSSIYVDILKIAVATIVYGIIYYLLCIAIKQSNFEVLVFLKILGIEIIYNMLIIMIIYPVTSFIGSKLKAIYKNNNILTRYF